MKKYKHGLYKFNNFFGSSSLGHNNKFNKAKSEHWLLPGPELEMSKKNGIALRAGSWLVAMMLGYVKNQQPGYFIATRGKR